MQALDKNMSKKGVKLTDAQLSDVYSESVEMIALNAKFQWKINLKIFVKQRSEGVKTAAKYAEYE